MARTEHERVVHVGPGGVFTDSLVHKPPSLDKKEEKAANTFIYEAPTTGSKIGRASCRERV